MKILLVGAGGVGDSIAKIAARRAFYEQIIVTDYDLARAERTVAWIAARHTAEVAARFVADRIDASEWAVRLPGVTRSPASRRCAALQAWLISVTNTITQRRINRYPQYPIFFRLHSAAAVLPYLRIFMSLEFIKYLLKRILPELFCTGKLQRNIE